MNSQKKHQNNWRINEYIVAKEVRVIGPDGKQIDIMSIDKALNEAKKNSLDLIEIAPKAKPPVVRIMDFGKFRYQEVKREREIKKKTKNPDVKEIRFSPFIGEADYRTRLERVKEFLEDGNKVRTVVKFRGREMFSKNYGYRIFDRILEEIGQNINIDMEPKFVGRHLTMVISPKSNTKKEKKNEEAENEKISS